MMQELPKILPVNELKNTANILKVCEESERPIVITRNGYGKAVIMSVEVYEKLFEKIELATLINESLNDFKNGGKAVDGKQFLNEMMQKYGK